MENLEEIWRTIDEFPDYEVSSFGRVRDKITKELKRILVYKRSDTYKIALVSLCGTSCHPSRLVAKAFPEICGEWFDGCEVHHLDKNPENNHAGNLVVCTVKEHHEYHLEEFLERCKKFKGVNHPLYGTHPSEETRKKMSESRKGEKNHNYGKPLSDETKEKLSESLKKTFASRTPERKREISEFHRLHGMLGKKHKDETRRKISKSHDKSKKAVYQYSLDGQFVREWASLTQIKRELGYNISQITRCCHGILKKTKGFKWRFKSDVD